MMHRPMNLKNKTGGKRMYLLVLLHIITLSLSPYGAHTFLQYFSPPIIRVEISSFLNCILMFTRLHGITSEKTNFQVILTWWTYRFQSLD